MSSVVTTKNPLSVADIKRFCNLHFTAAHEMHMTRGESTLMCILPMGSTNSFSVYIGGANCVEVTDEDSERSRRFCAALVACFDGKIEAP